MEKISQETMRKQVEQINKKSMTVEYRKMRQTAEKIEEEAGLIKENFDLVLYAWSLFIAFCLGIGVTLAVLWGLYHTGIVETEIPGGWKAFLASIVEIALAIFYGRKAIIAKLHTENGPIAQKFIGKGHKAKEYLDENLNTIVDTDSDSKETKVGENKNVLQKEATTSTTTT